MPIASGLPSHACGEICSSAAVVEKSADNALNQRADFVERNAHAHVPAAEKISSCLRAKTPVTSDFRGPRRASPISLYACEFFFVRNFT
jgi:hypothetical protein